MVELFREYISQSYCCVHIIALFRLLKLSRIVSNHLLENLLKCTLTVHLFGWLLVGLQHVSVVFLSLLTIFPETLWFGNESVSKHSCRFNYWWFWQGFSRWLLILGLLPQKHIVSIDQGFTELNLDFFLILEKLLFNRLIHLSKTPVTLLDIR